MRRVFIIFLSFENDFASFATDGMRGVTTGKQRRSLRRPSGHAYGYAISVSFFDF